MNLLKEAIREEKSRLLKEAITNSLLCDFKIEPKEYAGLIHMAESRDDETIVLLFEILKARGIEVRTIHEPERSNGRLF